VKNAIKGDAKRLHDTEKLLLEVEEESQRLHEAEAQGQDDSELQWLEVEADAKQQLDVETFQLEVEVTNATKRLFDAETLQLEVEAETKRLLDVQILLSDVEAETKRLFDMETLRLDAEAETKRLFEAKTLRVDAEAETKRLFEAETLRLDVEAETKRLFEAKTLRLDAEAETKRLFEAETLRLDVEAVTKRLFEAKTLRLDVEAETKRQHVEDNIFVSESQQAAFSTGSTVGTIFRSDRPGPKHNAGEEIFFHEVHEVHEVDRIPEPDVTQELSVIGPISMIIMPIPSTFVHVTLNVPGFKQLYLQVALGTTVPELLTVVLSMIRDIEGSAPDIGGCRLEWRRDGRALGHFTKEAELNLIIVVRGGMDGMDFLCSTPVLHSQSLLSEPHISGLIAPWDPAFDESAQIAQPEQLYDADARSAHHVCPIDETHPFDSVITGALFLVVALSQLLFFRMQLLLPVDLLEKLT